MTNLQSRAQDQSNQNGPQAGEVAKLLRAAIRQPSLEAVLRNAGATEIRGMALEVLQETAAAHVAATITTNTPTNIAAGSPAAPTGEALRLTRAAIDQPALAKALQSARISNATPEAVGAQISSFLAQASVEATRFASSQQRAVCHNCVAIGAARVARAPVSQSMADL